MARWAGRIHPWMLAWAGCLVLASGCGFDAPAFPDIDPMVGMSASATDSTSSHPEPGPDAASDESGSPGDPDAGATEATTAGAMESATEGDGSTSAAMDGSGTSGADSEST